ncbi:Imm63 family immunity protein [Streptomyces roseifaciens]|uniref:Imm63 family immunity protein n=1 Tax=Streptomyces roseifaciens TaxID=1488406 RepID=UPI000AEACE71|nr:Imm63 family immunity protein [Streptomyces roseifaciens]
MAAKLDGWKARDMIAFSSHDGQPYVVVDDGVFHWAVRERGLLSEHRTTESLEELLHWVALDTARGAAFGWELQMRQHFPHQDLGIGRLAKQLEVLDRLNPQWAAEFRAGIAENQPDVRLEDVDAYPLNSLAEQTVWVEQGRG